MSTTPAFRGPLLCLAVVALLLWQAAADNSHNTPGMGSSTIEELSTALAVNQLFIMRFINDFENISGAAAEAQRVNRGVRAREEAEMLKEEVRAHMEQVRTVIQAGQQQFMQQMLDALINGTHKLQSSIEEMRGYLRVELAQILLEAVNATKNAKEDEKVEDSSFSGILLHNDTLPSLCNGNKILNGTIGSLEVVASGSYTENTLCSWSLNFPKESSVTLTWHYIDMESQSSCSYDWVEVVYNSSHSQVYGRKLCGTIDHSILKLLNVSVHGVRNLLVSFRSDGSNQKRGFKLSYNAH